MVRCKFECQNVDPQTGKVVMFAVHSGSEENAKFFKYTPSASLDLQTVNPEAIKQFEQGKQYYVDISEA